MREGSVLAQLLDAQTRSATDVARAADLYEELNRDPGWTLVFRKKMISHDIQGMTEKERLLNDFLLAACVKDCSLFITLGRNVEADGVNAVAAVKLIDLDPKPVSRIPQYLKLDEAIRDLNS